MNLNSRDDAKGTIEEEELDISARIRNISDRMSLNRSHEKADVYRKVSSSIGSESPIGVLTELRESQERMLSVMKDMMSVMQETQKKEDIRHKEICTILLSLSMNTERQSRNSTSLSPSLSNGVQQKVEYFYGPVSLTSGVHIIACIMLHMDALLTQHPTFAKIKNTDKTFVDIKDWHTMCSSILNADKSSKVGLRIPKPSENDFKSAANIVSSPMQGRRPASDPSCISALMTCTPEIMHTVEWVRGAMLKCAGCLSPERHCRFRSIEYPFVGENAEILVEQKPRLTIPARTRHQEFLDLKATERKQYMNLILELSYSPNDAFERVKKRA